jgi:hypothetical protein
MPAVVAGGYWSQIGCRPPRRGKIFSRMGKLLARVRGGQDRGEPALCAVP